MPRRFAFIFMLAAATALGELPENPREQWGRHWAFQPIRAPGGGESIDGWIDAALRARNLEPLPRAESGSLLRRLHLVLTGLPPAPAEQESFANLATAEGIEAAVQRRLDELLTSPRFGERWAQHWLDVVRYAETKGHEYDFEIGGAWRFRDYVIRAFNTDLPFSEFAKEQICGDFIEPPRRDPDTGANESRLGTIFWNLGESQTSPVDLPNDEGDRLDNQVDTLGKAFLGLTVGCARCHDHKVDPISQRDYYALAGIAASSAMDRAWVDREEYAKAAALLLALRDEGDALREAGALPAVAAPPIAPERGRVIADFSNGIPEGWSVAGFAEVVTPGAAALRGVQPGLWSGLLSRKLPARVRSPLFNIESRSIDVIVSGMDATLVLSVNNIQVIREPIYDELRRRIDRPGRWQVHRFRVGRWMGQPAYFEAFTGTFDFLQTRASDRQQFGLRGVIFSDGPQPADLALSPLPASPDDWRLHELAGAAVGIEQALPLPEHYLSVAEPSLGMDRPLAERGDARRPGASVPRGFLPVVLREGSRPVMDGSGRREIAEALVNPANSLTARVFVNRVWHHLFGHGLVATPDDFGLLGEAPSHPELLDLLAHRFVHEHRWSTRELIREIVSSRAWQRSTSGGETETQWLRSYPLRRLDAEALRDSVLSVSGRLNLQMGGPGVPVRRAQELYGGGNDQDDGPVDGEGRRSIYLKVRRNFPEPLLAVFDKPAPSVTFGRRNVSNVPAQSLALLNDPFITGQSAVWADRVCRVHAGLDDRVRQFFLEALARPPQQNEVAAAREFLAGDDSAQAWAAYAQTFFNLKEFLYLP